MGFSVSGATAIIFIGMFISFGMVYSATANGFEEVSTARATAAEQVLDQQNTRINITNTTYNATMEQLSISVNNTGSTALSVTTTDFIVDNDYQQSFVDQTVDGDGTTDLWLPGETLTVNVSVPPTPTRIKVVTENGVATTEVR